MSKLNDSQCSELSLTYKVSKEVKRYQIKSPKDSFDYIKQFFPEDSNFRESFYAFYVDRSNNTLGYIEIGKGGKCGVVADVSMVIKGALDRNASGIGLTHNHPSNNMKASREDRVLTNKIKEACKIFSIELLDHVIISGDQEQYFSFANEGLI